MPDPVGDAIGSLLDRIEFLETRLAHLQSEVTGRIRHSGAAPTASMSDRVDIEDR
jgi:serine O-acetyltransferase